MLPELEQLLLIQDLDQKIRALKTDLDRLPREEDNAKLRLIGDQKSKDKIKQEIKVNEVAIKSLELDVDTRRDTIAKLKIQQFETRKNDEFQALNHEIERYQTDISNLEDNQLELMEVAEQLTADLNQAKETLNSTQQIVYKELTLINERRLHCDAHFSKANAERKLIATAIDPDLLNEFERIFISKKGDGIAELKHGICAGCHMKVTPATASAVRASKKIPHCDQCGRMLH
ncbi:MAG: C4-type zinc ribbon domain-containing protein [Verrucomicrobiales bacterium]